MRLRVYELLNMNRIDAEAARETIHMLYRVFNPNTLIDEGLEDGTIDQQFPFAIWRKKYPDLSVVTVRDLVMAPGINRRAIDRIYNRIIKAFFKSDEYNSREYRYLDYHDYLIHRG